MVIEESEVGESDALHTLKVEDVLATNDDIMTAQLPRALIESLPSFPHQVLPHHHPYRSNL